MTSHPHGSTGFEADDWGRFSPFLNVHARSRVTPPKRWLAPGFLALGELSAFFGEPGATKSVLAIDHACRIAAGIGWDGLPTGQRHGVLYIARERPDQVRRRVDAFTKAHDIERLDNLVIYDGPLDLSERTDDLVDLALAAQFATTTHDDLDGWEIDLIVIDTLAASMGKPDSDTFASSAAAENLTRAARDTGAHILAVHHQPLSGESRLRGGHLTAAMDLTVQVKKTRAGSVATVIKDNGTAEGDRVRLTYTLRSVDLVCSDGSIISEPVVEPSAGAAEPDTTEDDAAPPAIKLTAPQSAVLAALQQLCDEGGTADADTWRTEADKSAGQMSPSGLRKRFGRAKEFLLATGLVVPEGHGFHPSGTAGQGGTIVPSLSL